MTITIEETKTDDLIVTEPLPDKDEPCEFFDICGNSAEWECRLACCNWLLLLDSDCLITLKEQMTKVSLAECRHCGEASMWGPDMLKVIGRLKK